MFDGEPVFEIRDRKGKCIRIWADGGLKIDEDIDLADRIVVNRIPQLTRSAIEQEVLRRATAENLPQPTSMGA